MANRLYSFKYTGDGNDNRNLGGCPFNVSSKGLAWVKPTDTTANDGAMSWVGMGSDLSIDPNAAANPSANKIQAFQENGIQVGTDANVNSNGVDYQGVIISGDPSTYYEGSYTGNSTTSNPITGVGFRPDLIIIKRTTSTASVGRFWFRPSGQANVWAATNGSTGFLTDDADGFTITTTNSSVNASGSTYRFVCLKLETGYSEYVSWTGNATDNRDITTSFNPEFVWIKTQSGSQAPVFRTTANSGDNTTVWTLSTANIADSIQSFGDKKFTIGTNATANRNATSIDAFVMRDNSTGNFFPFF